MHDKGLILSQYYNGQYLRDQDLLGILASVFFHAWHAFTLSFDKCQKYRCVSLSADQNADIIVEGNYKYVVCYWIVTKSKITDGVVLMCFDWLMQQDICGGYTKSYF